MNLSREEMREIYVRDAPVTRRRVIESAYAGTCSPRKAIKAKCLECTNFAPAEITACSSSLCPLFAFRPYQTSRKKRPSEAAE